MSKHKMITHKTQKSKTGEVLEKIWKNIVLDKYSRQFINVSNAHNKRFIEKILQC